MTGDGVPRVTKLDTDNHLQWAVEIEHIMRFKGCWVAVAPKADATPHVGPTPPRVEGEVDAGADASKGAGSSAAHAAGMNLASDAAEAEALKEEQAMSLIVLNVKPHHLSTFRRHSTARGAWEALEREFRSCDPARMLNLRRELTTLKMGRKESVVRYFNRGRALVLELEALGADVGDDQFVTALLVGLQGKYDLVATVLAVQPGITVEMAQEQLQATETRLDLTNGADVGGALTAAEKSRPRAHTRGGHGDRPMRRNMAYVRCYECNELGHYKRNCTKRANGGRPGSGGAGAAGLAMMALVSDGTPALGTWVMDSGTSHHMTGEAGLLTDAKQCATVHILLADGREGVATTSGTVHLTIEVDGGETTLSLLDVLVVPGLTTSLFFVRQASARG